MLRATTWTHGRRGALIGASAAVVCLGGLLAACAGGGDGDGRVAVGAPGGSRTAVTPTGEVTLVPLEPREPSAPANAPAESGTSTQPPPRGTPSGTGDAPDPSARAADQSRTPTSSPTPTPTGTASPTPAALSWSEPKRESADKRWCEKVTLGFHNSGGRPVRSGTVTFGTHIIGALGIDWGTVESVEELPVPVAAGARKEKSWTVCVDAMGVPPLESIREWGRVPLGVHIETRDVSVQWK